jgi:hypothetical protein
MTISKTSRENVEIVKVHLLVSCELDLLRDDENVQELCLNRGVAVRDN